LSQDEYPALGVSGQRHPFETMPNRSPRDAEAWLDEAALAAPEFLHGNIEPQTISAVPPLSDLTAVEMIQLFRAREVSPVEVVEALIRHVETSEGRISAIISLEVDSAISSAKESEKRYLTGTERPLEGVPYGLKDNIAVAGLPTSASSVIYADNIAARDSSVQARLAGAGAVFLAKHNLYPFAIGDEGDETFGPTLNPWDLARTPGGSSAGTAASVAARQMPFGLGTDTGGSIRLPSAWCGITGLKPTNGRVPRTGILPLSWTLDTVGPMARCANDIGLVLDVIAGPDGEDRDCRDAPRPNHLASTSAGVRGLRLGIPSGWLTEQLHPEVDVAFRCACECLESQGVELVTVRLPNAPLSMEIGWDIILAELGSIHEANTAVLESYDAVFRQYVIDAKSLPVVTYLEALRSRVAVQDDFRRAFSEVDAVAVPGHISVAPRLGEMLLMTADGEVPWLEVAARHTFPFNIAGLPSIALPTGLTENGLPMSMQIAAAPYREDICLALAGEFQRVTSFHQLAPPLVSDAGK